MPQSKFVHLLDGTPCTGRQMPMEDTDVHICDAHDRRTVTREVHADRLASAEKTMPVVGDTLTSRHLTLPHGSVVIAHSATGTAYQRHHVDGLYHGTNGRMYTQMDLLRYCSPCVVLYVVPKDDTRE